MPHLSQLRQLERTREASIGIGLDFLLLHQLAIRIHQANGISCPFLGLCLVLPLAIDDARIMKGLPRPVDSTVGEKLDMLFGLVCHLVVVISHPRVRNRHGLVRGRLCLQTNSSLLALRQHHHPLGIGDMTFLQLIASTLDLKDADFCSRNRMSATLVQHYDFLFILRQSPMNHLQTSDVYQHPYFGIPMSVGCSQNVIKSQSQAIKGYRILTHLIVGSSRKVEMLITNQGAVFTDCLGKRGFSQRRRFHRKVHPIYLQPDAREVGMARLYPYRTFGINGSQLQLQLRIQNLPFLVLQGIDAVVMRISADSLLKQGQTFLRLQLHPDIGQSKIHLGTHFEVGILLYPLTELLLVGLRIGIEGSQEPCRTHAFSLIDV